MLLRSLRSARQRTTKTDVRIASTTTPKLNYPRVDHDNDVVVVGARDEGVACNLATCSSASACGPRPGLLCPTAADARVACVEIEIGIEIERRVGESVCSSRETKCQIQRALSCFLLYHIGQN